MVRASMIHHMNVPIDDIDTARDFYGRVLGLAGIKRPDVGRPGLWYGCGVNELHLSVQPGLCGGRTAMSLQPTDRPDRTGGHVAFTMSGSLDDVARCLEAERIPYARGRSGLPQLPPGRDRLVVFATMSCRRSLRPRHDYLLDHVICLE